MLDIIGQCEGPKGQKRNSSVSQCRLLGAKQTSISGTWTSDSSHKRTFKTGSHPSSSGALANSGHLTYSDEPFPQPWGPVSPASGSLYAALRKHSIFSLGEALYALDLAEYP